MITYKLRQAHLDYAVSQMKRFGLSINGGGFDNYIGVLGELAFGGILQSAGIPFAYTGPSKVKWDFVVRGTKIDVKTHRVKGDYPITNRMHGLVRTAQDHGSAELFVFCFLRWPESAAPSAVEVCWASNCEDFFIHPCGKSLKPGDNHENMQVYEACTVLQGQHMVSVENLLRQL